MYVKELFSEDDFIIVVNTFEIFFSLCFLSKKFGIKINSGLFFTGLLNACLMVLT